MLRFTAYIIGFMLAFIFAGCSSLKQPNDGSGVYYQSGGSADQESNKKAANNKQEKSKNHPTSSLDKKDQPKQPSEVNPKSKSAYSSSSKTETSSDDSIKNFNYYPDERSHNNKVYGSSSNYYDYKYTNRISRFESDLNRSFYSPYNRRPNYGYHSFYRNPSRFQNGLSISAGFGSRGYFNRSFGYRYSSFYDPFDYPFSFRNDFYTGGYGFNDPCRAFGYRFNSSGPGYYRPGYGYPYGSYASGDNRGDKKETINRPRDPLGSNYNTDKTKNKQPRQERGEKVKSRQKQENKGNAKSDNRQYDYYRPDEDRRRSRDYQKKRGREDRNKRNKSQRRNHFNESERGKPSGNNRRDRGLNRQNEQEQFNRQNRPRNENKKRRSPSRDRRKSRSNNDDGKMNRPRR